MSEGAPEYVAAEPAAETTSVTPADDRYGAAYQELSEAAAAVRGTIFRATDALPFSMDLNAATLEHLARLAAAVDEFEAAEEQLVQAARAADDEPATEVDAAAAIATLPLWREGFTAGASAQRRELIQYARGRGWASTAAALEIFPLANPPAPPAEVVTTMPGDAHEA